MAHTKVFVLLAALLLAVPMAFADELSDFVGRGTSQVGSMFDSIFGWAAAGGSCEAPGTPAGTGSWLNFAYMAWLAPIGLILFILVMIYILIYLAGLLLQSQNLVHIAKEEFFQVGLTALRVVFITATILAANQWYTMNIPAGTRDPIYSGARTYIDASINFSQLMVKDMATNFSSLLMYNMIIHTLFSATMWFGVTWRAMFSFNLGPVLKPLIDILAFSMQFLGVGIGEWVVHIATLCIIKKWSYALFIPVGMLMRAIPFLRGAGDAFLALILSFSLFYPFMFIVSYEAYKLMGCNVFGAFSSEAGGARCGSADPNSPLMRFIQDYGAIGAFGIFSAVLLIMGGVFIPFFLSGGLSIAFELVRSAVFFIVIMSLVLPLISIFMTLNAARETARFFNVDINFFAFVRLI